MTNVDIYAKPTTNLVAKACPVHRIEKKMDTNKERVARRNALAYIIQESCYAYNRHGNKVLLNGSTNLGPNLDIIC